MNPVQDIWRVVWWTWAALALAFLAVIATPVFAQETDVQRGVAVPVKVQLEGVPTGSLVTILMRDVLKVPYVIAPEVLADKKPVSVNLVMPRRELPVRVVRFLRGIGMTVRLDGGTVYVSKGVRNVSVSGSPVDPVAAASVPSGSPLAPPQRFEPPQQYVPAADPPRQIVAGISQQSESEEEPPSIVAIIRPAHRSPGEVAEFLSDLLPALTISARNDTGAENVTRPERFDGDALAVAGHPDDVLRAVDVARAIDKPRPQVEIRAVLFEVRSTETRSSALSILAEVAGASVQLGTPGVGDQVLRFASGGLQAVLAATRSDGRFKVIAEPSLAALSGSTATINAGSQVPTLGAVSFAEDGQAIRSVVYRDSGVSLTVAPTVRAGEIELVVQQERSSFARTTTGVDDSPTLNRATASAQLALVPGETVALAGLKETSDSDGRQKYLGGLFGGRSRDKSEAELLLLIQADIAPVRPSVGLTVEIIGQEEEAEDAA